MKEFTTFSFCFRAEEQNETEGLIEGLSHIIPSDYMDQEGYRVVLIGNGNVSVIVEKGFENDINVQRLKSFLLALENLRK